MSRHLLILLNLPAINVLKKNMRSVMAVRRALLIHVWKYVLKMPLVLRMVKHILIKINVLNAAYVKTAVLMMLF